MIHLILLLILKNTMLIIFKNTKYTKAAAFNNLSRRFLTFQTPISQNGQIADELFECVCPFYGIGAYRVKG